MLSEGLPLSGLPVELRSNPSQQGIRRTSDGQRMVSLALQLAARRVLRGIHLRPAAGEPENGKATS